MSCKKEFLIMATKGKGTIEFRFYDVPQGEAALVLCGKSWIRRYGAGETNLHFHNLWEIGVCRYGKGELQLNDQINHYNDGDISIIPENFPHITRSAGEKDNYWEYIFFDFRSLIEEMFPNNKTFQINAINSLSKKAVLMNSGKNPVVRDCIDAIIREAQMHKAYNQKVIFLMLQNLVIELLRMQSSLPEVKENKSTSMSQVIDAIEYIDKHFGEAIKAADLAAICSVSQTHFRRQFEKHMNMPPMEYLNLIRIQKACEFMKKTNESMDVIAQRCGFANFTTFNRNFKRFVGTSPYQWKINPDSYEHKVLNYNISALKGWK